MTHAMSLIALPLTAAPAVDQCPPLPRRERLIRGLATVLARDGYRDSKIRDVAGEARVSLRTFYEEFSTKDEVLVALDDVLHTQMLASVRRLVIFDGPLRVVVHRAFSECIAVLLAHPNLTRAMLVDLATLSDEFRLRREEGLQEFATLLCELVDEGRAAYADVPSAPLTPFTARSIVGAVAELASSQGADGTPPDVARFADTMTDLLLGVVIQHT